jgi:hemerythrin
MGIKELDEQHKKMFELGGRISQLVFDNSTKDYLDEIMSILKKLREYTKYHLMYEEEHMKLNEYVHQHTHTIHHSHLTERIERIEDKVISSKQKETLMEMINFIYDWISKHILKEDMKYKEFLKTRVERIRIPNRD